MSQSSLLFRLGDANSVPISSQMKILVHCSPLRSVPASSTLKLELRKAVTLLSIEGYHQAATLKPPANTGNQVTLTGNPIMGVAGSMVVKEWG
jgi:hypothetical protein